MVNNVKTFASVLMPGVVHMRHTHLPEHKFISGQPETGVELAEDLERILQILEQKILLHALLNQLQDQQELWFHQKDICKD